MNSVADTFNLALRHHQNGNWAEAESTYRAVLTTDPSHADAHHMLGILSHQKKDHDAAIVHIRRALDLAPSNAAYYFSLANIYMTTGQLAEAAECCRQTLKLNPTHPQAHNTMGVILQGMGKVPEAIASYRQALRIESANLSARNNLATALLHQKQFGEAEELLRRALQIKPDYAMAHVNLGNALREQGKLAEATQCFRKAAELNPQMPEAHYNLGNVLLDQNQCAAATDSFQQALRFNPNHAEAQHNLGKSLERQGILDDAIAAYRQALRLNAKSASAHVDLGNALKERGSLDEAGAAYQAACTLEPDNHAWQSNRLYTLLYQPTHDAQTTLAEHRRWAEHFASPTSAQPFANVRDLERRLRLGYISPDLRNHVNGDIVWPLICQRDKRQFELFLYSNRATPDEVTWRFREKADHWREVADWSDERVAEAIRQDGIDILVDVTVHMGGNRLPVFARKPAPVQITYAGYPGTTGLAAMDYRFTDPFLDPPGLFEDRYIEKTYRLPHTFWCYVSPSEEPHVRPLPALENGYITFGCLNNFCKINEGVLELWAPVLRAVPTSRLKLLAQEGSHRDEVRAYLAQHGVAAERIEFYKRRPRLDYLALNHQIDIGLDTLPYNGHVTSLDSMWMGVPVVTLVGTTVVGRAGMSQLSNLGLTELVATTPDDFGRIAIALAGDLPRLKELRASLRARMQASPLMDAAGFTSAVEKAYREMWRAWCNRF